MLKKLDLSKKKGNHSISILYPGLYLSETDTGYYSVGRIDHATIRSGVVIRMHPHVNDDILSYFRSGKVKHTDSEGFEELIRPDRLMLMKAGSTFYHEEAIEEDMEGLQLFIRPGEKDASPAVLFEDLEDLHSLNAWRLLASPDMNKTKLALSSQTHIYDAKLTAGNQLSLPEGPEADTVYLVYVFQGDIHVNDAFSLAKGESLVCNREDIRIRTEKEAELVLFSMDTKAAYYDGGMYSGNKKDTYSES